MSFAEFKISGIGGRDAHRWRQASNPSRPVPLSWGWPGLAAAAVVAFIGLAPPTASLHGTDVSGSHVLLLVDISGSMPDARTTADPQIQAMRAAGISVANRIDVPGWSWGSGAAYSFLGALEGGISKSPLVDTVYIITDFTAGDDQGNDAAGLSRFRQLLARRHLRLYWCTVRDPVPEDYRRIALWTGGGVARFSPGGTGH